MSNIKKIFIDNMELLNSMHTKERVLYRKWYEINTKYSIDTSDFFDDPIVDPHVQYIKNKLWTYSGNPDEYLTIQPEVIHCNTPELKKVWGTMRVFCSTHIWNGIPGKIQKFIVKDSVSGKFIGFMALSSDLKDIGGRNDYIGWTKEDRYEGGMLDSIAIGSTIIPTQPFGFNFIGGKLLALLLCSDVVVDVWEKTYGKQLAGITTSSLYGGKSQYNSLMPYWRKCKSSEGKDILKPMPDVWKLCKEYSLSAYPDKYTGSDYNKRKLNHQGTVIADLRRDFGVPKYINNEPRGVYFNRLYDNTNEFLCRKVKTLEGARYDNCIDTMTDVWRKKCSNRVKNLSWRDGFITEGLIYDDIIGISWDACKEKYLNI